MNMIHIIRWYISPVFDCEVSAWSAWTECSSSCGSGTSTRSRTVTRPESNGGVSCPDLHQEKFCRGEGGCTRRKEEPRLITHKKHGASSALRGEILLWRLMIILMMIIQRLRWFCLGNTASWQRWRKKRRSMMSDRTSRHSRRMKMMISEILENFECF